MKESLVFLIAESKRLGLSDDQVKFPLELVEHYEFGEAVHILATRLSENNVIIPQEFYEQLSGLAIQMKMEEAEYIFVKPPTLN